MKPIKYIEPRMSCSQALAKCTLQFSASSTATQMTIEEEENMQAKILILSVELTIHNCEITFYALIDSKAKGKAFIDKN